MACTKKYSKTVIKIADVEVGKVKIILRGHHDLIHDMSWSQDDNYLVSASADGGVKLWNLTQKETDYSQKMNYLENDSFFFICQLPHSSYVYAAQIYPSLSFSEQQLTIATACFDGKVRLWVVDVESAYHAHHQPKIVLSLDDAEQRIVDNKRSYGEMAGEQLDDEALALLIKP